MTGFQFLKFSIRLMLLTLIGMGSIAETQPLLSEGRSMGAESGETYIERDFQSILAHSVYKTYRFHWRKVRSLVFTQRYHQELNAKNIPIALACQKNEITLTIPEALPLAAESSTSASELDSAKYWLLHELGFLFPHPKVDISPTSTENLKKLCGHTILWQPALKTRGFHIHLQHPSEWVDGFLGDSPQIGKDYVLWMKRNFQNTLQVQLLRSPLVNEATLKEVLYFAKQLNLNTSLSVSFALRQQKSYFLIPFYKVLFQWKIKEEIENQIDILNSKYPFNVLAVELGTTEFTSTPFQNTLDWIDWTEQKLLSLHKELWIKTHASLGQFHPKFGNYNFLAQWSDKGVSMLPHTVMFYGLTDAATPMYGRTNFHDLQNLMTAENQKRKVIYYPETSYYIGMDIDIPLFLTNYLYSRSQDLTWMKQNHIDHLIDFTTGHEMGYWFFDWSLALQSSTKYFGDPLAGAKLLNEDVEKWHELLAFQDEYFKDKKIISMLSSANLMDELPFLESIHQRNTWKALRADKSKLEYEIELLKQANSKKMSLDFVKNKELKSLLQVTWNRLEQALALREYLLNHNQKDMIHSEKILVDSSQLLESYFKYFARYKDSLCYQRRENPTSYPEGYAKTAMDLHFWKREQQMVKDNISNPFFMNLYDPVGLLF
jgi:hypothetical protein